MPYLNWQGGVEEKGWRSWLLPVFLAFILHLAMLWLLTSGESRAPLFPAAQVMRVTMVHMMSPKPTDPISMVLPEDANPVADETATNVVLVPKAKTPLLQPRATLKEMPELFHESASVGMASMSPPAQGTVRDSEPAFSAAFLKNPVPRYPNAARRRGLQGRVLLNVEVLDSGLCGQINVLESCGHEILDQAALDAVKQWHFVPAYHDGEPVTRWFQVPIRFELTGR